MSKKTVSRLILILISILVVIYPVILSTGRLLIGGDTMIPLSSSSLFKYMFTWLGVLNGIFMPVNYYPLYGLSKLCELMGLSVYDFSLILLILLRVLSVIGIYKLTKLIFKENFSVQYIFALLFYLYSPALLNGWSYLYIYSSIPWVIYYLYKVSLTNTNSTTDIIGINLILFISSMDLPNPKYIFHISIIALVFVATGLFLKIITRKKVFKIITYLVFTILIQSYLILPYSYFVLRYQPEAYSVHTKVGYKDSGKMMDFGTATISKMFRLHHDGINTRSTERVEYVSNTSINILSYTFGLITIISLIFFKRFSKDDQKIYLVFLTLYLIYLFFAVGPNPPFGFLYQTAIERIPLLAFLRTTAGGVFFVSIFQTILLCFSIKTFQKLRLPLLFILIVSLVITSYPVFNGQTLENINAINQHYTSKHGYKIPNDYFIVNEILKNQKYDGRILVKTADPSYINTKWGYFGPPIYNFLFDKSIVTSDKLAEAPEKINFSYILDDKSIINSSKQSGVALTEGPMINPGDLQLSYVDIDKVTPHIQIQVDIKKKSESKNQNIVEFRKINPTKYLVVIHKAEKNIKLVLNENYHPGWKIYANKLSRADNLQKQLEAYKIILGNEYYQADKSELKSFLGDNLISDLGSPYTFTPDAHEVNFVSKLIRGSIQNDNLQAPSILSTLLTPPIVPEENHLISETVNNTWTIDTDILCQQSPKSCVKNTDDTYEISLTVEFWPQRLFYLGLFISGTTLLGCLIFAFRNWVREKRI